MPALSAYVAGPYGGVSQAPPQVRTPDTCEAMVDCIATIPNGIQKRPPLRYLGTPVTANASAQATFQEIPRGSPSADMAFILNAEPTIGIKPYLFNLLSASSLTAVSVSANAQSYLNTGATSPIQSFRSDSIEDYTFITNRNVQVGNSTATASTRPFEALIWCKTGEYARVYTIQVVPVAGTTVTANYQPSTGASSNDAKGVGTDVIMNALYSGAVVSGSGGVFSGTSLNALTSQGFTVTHIGSLIYISHPTNNFALTVIDDQGGLAMEGIYKSVQAFSDLPAVAVNGFTVEISQDQAGGNGSYWLQFVSTTATSGYWQEVPQPGSALGVDTHTMPVALTVNETTGAWALDIAAWSGRTTGNTALVPDPGFIGDYITDVSWWRGRLVLLYNGGLSLSASDSPFKYYTTTLTTDLDSDPIGFLTPVDRKTFFKQVLTFDQRLFAFADRCQAAVTTSGGPPTPSSAVMTTIAQSSFSDGARVQTGNHKVYYLVNRTSSALLYGLAIDRLSGLALEEDLTPAIPQYLPTTLDRAATWEADYITVYGASGSGTLFVRVYREQDYQRVQNAFFQWQLPAGLQCSGMFFKNSVLYLYLVDPTSGKGHIFSMDMTPSQVQQGSDSNVSTVQQYLDFMIPDTSCTVAYSGGNTTFTLPIASEVAPWGCTTRAPWVGNTNNPGAYPEAYATPQASQTTTTVILTGDWRGCPLWFGLTYPSYFIPTQWYVTGPDKKPMHDGRLSLKRLKADVANYGYIRAEVTLAGRGTRMYTFEGTLLDDATTPIGSPPNRETVVLNVPLAGKAEDVQVKFISDSWLGFKLLGYEWRGDWNPKSRRVT